MVPLQRLSASLPPPPAAQPPPSPSPRVPVCLLPLHVLVEPAHLPAWSSCAGQLAGWLLVAAALPSHGLLPLGLPLLVAVQRLALLHLVHLAHALQHLRQHRPQADTARSEVTRLCGSRPVAAVPRQPAWLPSQPSLTYRGASLVRRDLERRVRLIALPRDVLALATAIKIDGDVVQAWSPCQPSFPVKSRSWVFRHVVP